MADFDELNFPDPKRYDFMAHGLAAEEVASYARKAVLQLQEAGFEAYIVGGAVRDLLLGLAPKDFDIATSAHPEEVRALFRRSRIIGKRFRIVHVFMNGQLLEVTTFRGGDNQAQNEHGRIMHDNTYGTLAQDAGRRDFSCNALYYDPAREEILDFHAGIDAIRARELRMIGEPMARFQEDPVRILRAARLSAKLGFTLEPALRAAIGQQAHRIKQEPIARLFDEILKLMFCGRAGACFAALDALNLGAQVHPLLQQYATTPREHEFIQEALARTDARIADNQPVSAGFLLACLLWPRVQRDWVALSGSLKETPALLEAIARTSAAMQGWGVPQRYTAVMREIWAAQSAFSSRRGARPLRFLAQKRFRAAYDFLLLRTQTGESPPQLAKWWTDFQQANEAQRLIMAQHQPVNGDDGAHEAQLNESEEPQAVAVPHETPAAQARAQNGGRAMNIAIIALGSNLDAPEEQLRRALGSLFRQPDIQSVATSGFYASAPVGYADQPDFVNAVAMVRTTLSARALLQRLHDIEAQAGRVRSFRNAPRTLDLDLIDYEGRAYDGPELTLPHPRALERAFVMQPLCDIAPDYVIAGVRAREALDKLDSGGLKRLEAAQSAAEKF